MFRIFCPLFLSVFGWLFTKITYSTLVLSYHILDITYQVGFFLFFFLEKRVCCAIYTCPCHTCLMLKTVFCLVGVLCIVELNTRSILSIFFATLALLYTLCYLQCAQYKRQPTDCHRCRARLYTQSTYEPALGKASKNETKNKYENEDEWDQIGKHKDSRNAIWNKIAQKKYKVSKEYEFILRQR